MPDRLYIDFETRSAADLKKTGAWRYAEDPTTGVFCMAYAFNNEQTDIWVEGDPLPIRIRRHILDGGEVHAWNAMFELAIWTRICAVRFGWPQLLISQLRCTMAAAACQSAFKRDPVSASKKHPSLWLRRLARAGPELSI